MAGREDATQGREPEDQPAALHVQGDELRALLAASDKHGVPPVDLTALRLSLAELDQLPQEIARRHKALPLLARPDVLFVAMANPSDPKAREELEFVCGRKLLLFVADPARLDQLIDTAYDARARGEEHLDGDNVRPRVPPPPPLPARVTPGAPAVSARQPRPLPSRSRTLLSNSSGPPLEAQTAVGPMRLQAPATPAPSALPSFVPLAPAPTPPPVLSLGTRAVWIVSAAPDARSSLSHSFTNFGHAARTFDTAASFRAATEDVLPDVVFLDPALPDGHGFEVLKALRATPRTASLAVVLLLPQGASWRLDRDLRAVLGVASTLTTPASESDLLARFEAALNPGADDPSSRALSGSAEGALQASTDAYLRGDVDGAIRQLQRGIELAPRSYRLHYQLALLQGRQGAVHAAIASLERSVGLFDGFFPALKNLAVLYERVGFLWSAADAWERALSVAPDPTTRAQIKEHLGVVAPTQRS